MSAALSENLDRGSRLLLSHCRILATWDRSPATDRLVDQLGGDLARKLVYALARPQVGRDGSSSP